MLSKEEKKMLKLLSGTCMFGFTFNKTEIAIKNRDNVVFDWDTNCIELLMKHKRLDLVKQHLHEVEIKPEWGAWLIVYFQDKVLRQALLQHVSREVALEIFKKYKVCENNCEDYFPLFKKYPIPTMNTVTSAFAYSGVKTQYLEYIISENNQISMYNQYVNFPNIIGPHIDVKEVKNHYMRVASWSYAPKIIFVRIRKLCIMHPELICRNMVKILNKYCTPELMEILPTQYAIKHKWDKRCTEILFSRISKIERVQYCLYHQIYDEKFVYWDELDGDVRREGEI